MKPLDVSTDLPTWIGFAAAALTGILANRVINPHAQPEDVAAAAGEVADAMLKEFKARLDGPVSGNGEHP